MDFVRRWLLVLCISLCGFVSTSTMGGTVGNASPQTGSARASNSRDTPTPVRLASSAEKIMPATDIASPSASTKD